MATDAIETETELTFTSDMDLNKSDPEPPDTPRIFENQENGPTETLISEEEEPDISRNRTEPLSESSVDALLQSPTKTGDPLQETAAPDNGEKQEPTEVRTSSPVGLSLPPPPLQLNGSLERQESAETTEARLRLEGVELKEEWQDEDFPRPLPEEEEEEDLEQELFNDPPAEEEAGAPSYGINSDKKVKKKLEAPDISLTLARTGTSALSDELEESTELDLDDIDTPSDNSNEFDWEGIIWEQDTSNRHVSLLRVVRFQSPKPRSCCRRVWSPSRSIQPGKRGRRAGAGGSSGSVTKSTEWT
ncbi:hypothetical protein JZ751_020576 [Albula glossodonta]|uniref:Uncharacterized protein n=1 Tax=Albula glossodonta TaxID=121402 RepID=A0A8T2PFR2_9TELE|nr:hypothetical protein JZ751_020576 [Albula glossodonta]